MGLNSGITARQMNRNSTFASEKPARESGPNHLTVSYQVTFVPPFVQATAINVANVPRQHIMKGCNKPARPFWH
jgi:hypothetical protein